MPGSAGAGLESLSSAAAVLVENLNPLLIEKLAREKNTDVNANRAMIFFIWRLLEKTNIKQHQNKNGFLRRGN